MAEEKRTQYMQAIWQITEDLRNASQLEEAFADALRTVVRTIGAEAGTIWFLNQEDNRLYPVFNIGPTDISGISIANGEGIAGNVVQTGTSEVVEDCTKDPRFTGAVDVQSGFRTESLICVPLKNKYETIGCIQILNKQSGGMFGQDEVVFCENMASLIAIAVDERGFLVRIGKEKKKLLSLRDVTKVYHAGTQEVPVLKGVNLDIYEHELVVILGESGCGKSTLLNIIGGMDFLTDGTFMINGKDYSHPSEKELTMYRRNQVGFIFQAYNLMPNLTAKENLNFIGELCKDPMDAEEALEKVGLGERKNNYPSQMSGGQQQRVSIARAIVKKPKLILADEPTAALDFQTGQEILQVLEEILAVQGTTIVMVTHNIEIAKMANRVVRMKNGVVADIKINMHPAKAEEIQW